MILQLKKYQIEKVCSQVGFMNNLAELLNSPPDEISELNGVELVKKKVIQYQLQSSLYLNAFDQINIRRSPW